MTRGTRMNTSNTGHLAILSLFVSILFTSAAMAERSAEFGEYQIHYNALRTDVIEPGIARAYGIIRSKNRALVNVAILRKVMGMATQPVRAKVSVSAVNLNSQLREIDIRELDDNGAIYYIGEIPINNNETLKFNLTVTPADETQGYTTSFEQEFFTE